MLSEKKVIEIIKKRSQMQTNVRKKIIGIYKEMETAEVESIETVTFHSSLGKLNICGNQSTDLLKVLERQKATERNYNQELQIRLEELQGELYMIQRVWTCYQSLPVAEYEILFELYEKDKPWKAVEAELKINHKTLVRKRKNAIERILKWSCSTMTNAEIIQEKEM